jgi:hypothetical protein
MLVNYISHNYFATDCQDLEEKVGPSLRETTVYGAPLDNKQAEAWSPEVGNKGLDTIYKIWYFIIVK